MSFRITQDPGDPGSDRVSSGSLGGVESQLERRLLRDGVQVIARGTLVCPECELPQPASPAVRAAQPITCSWCGHTAPARELLRTGASGAPASAARLVARLG